jgi:hypothetical protein
MDTGYIQRHISRCENVQAHRADLGRPSDGKALDTITPFRLDIERTNRVVSWGVCTFTPGSHIYSSDLSSGVCAPPVASPILRLPPIRASSFPIALTVALIGRGHIDKRFYLMAAAIELPTEFLLWLRRSAEKRAELPPQTPSDPIATLREVLYSLRLSKYAMGE